MLRLSLAVSLALLLAGCAASGPAAGPSRPSAHAGFDTWRYPGEETMAVWKTASPYDWVGVYLPAPCHRDASWSGRRREVESMGWGTAVIYVGQQAFDGLPDPDSTSTTPVVCSRTLLTDSRGRQDGLDAAAATAREGFAPGTVIYLDVERTERVSPALVTYVSVWMATVLRDGRFLPGLYVHLSNAVDLGDVGQRAYAESGPAGRPPLWVAGGSGFSLERHPEDVGLAAAEVWQGALDVERTWGGRTLTIDENVSLRPSPSRPAEPSR